MFEPMPYMENIQYVNIIYIIFATNFPPKTHLGAQRETRLRPKLGLQPQPENKHRPTFEVKKPYKKKAMFFLEKKTVW